MGAKPKPVAGPSPFLLASFMLVVGLGSLTIWLNNRDHGSALFSFPQTLDVPAAVAAPPAAAAGGNHSAEHHSHSGSPPGRQCQLVSRPIPPLKTRFDIAGLCQQEGLSVGVELGVQNGNFAKQNLQKWPACKKYYLVDLWAPLKNYVDGSNVPKDKQDVTFQRARKAVEQWKPKAVFLRNYTTQAVHQVHEQIDFVYVDARHDYCGVLEDIATWWPKIKPGGLMAGHDFHDAAEAKAITKWNNWSVCGDGSTHNGAVKGAVLEFFAKRKLQVVVTYSEKAFHSWLVRKPELMCTGAT